MATAADQEKLVQQLKAIQSMDPKMLENFEALGNNAELMKMLEKVNLGDDDEADEKAEQEAMRQMHLDPDKFFAAQMQGMASNLTTLRESTERFEAQEGLQTPRTSRGGTGKGQPPPSKARDAANALFKEGDLPGAVAAYNAALMDPEEERLPLLSNLGLCHLKLSQPQLALSSLQDALSEETALQDYPKLATKAAVRLIQAYEAVGDEVRARITLAAARTKARLNPQHATQRNSACRAVHTPPLQHTSLSSHLPLSTLPLSTLPFSTLPLSTLPLSTLSRLTCRPRSSPATTCCSLLFRRARRRRSHRSDGL